MASAFLNTSDGDLGSAIRRLPVLLDLGVGWDGYRAKSPDEVSAMWTRFFLAEHRDEDVKPERVSASVVGGIGVLYRRVGRKAYVEFYNGGGCHALLSDGAAEPETWAVDFTPQAFRAAIERIGRYLAGD